MIDNVTFLRAIFGDDYIWAHVTSFPDDPNEIPSDRRFICWGGDYFSRTTIQPGNQYFTISTFYADSSNKARRRKSLFRCTHVIVADDVREKLDPAIVSRLPPPSYKLETSPGSEQWGWILDTPCTDRARVENLLDGLVAQGLAPDGKDPGMKGVTRYVRFPEGINTKASRVKANGGIAPACRMLEWEPDRKATLESLAHPFSVNLQAERKDTRVDGAADLPDHPLLDLTDLIHVKQILSEGRFDITCPWVADHTNQIDNGTAVFTNGDGSIGFKCHHGSCQHRTGNDLLDLIEESHAGFRGKLTEYKVFRDFQKILGQTPPPAQPKEDLSNLSFLEPKEDLAHLTDLSVASGLAKKASPLFLTFQEMIDLQMETDWLIDGFLESQSIALLFGEPGCMKSFLAVDIGLCISTGKDWHGKVVKNSGPVFYIAGEGFAGISRRLKAWKDYRNPENKNIPFYTSRTSVEFLDEKSVQIVVAEIEKFSEQHGPPVLVIIDTLNRNFGPGDENSTLDMTKLIQSLDRVKSRLNCSILIVHHSGLREGNRSRGSSALRGAVDWEYLLKVEGEFRTLYSTKSKDHELPPKMRFRPKVVNLGFSSKDFEQITSCVLEAVPTGSSFSIEPSPKLTQPEALVLRTLNELITGKESGRVHIDEWREAAMRQSISESSKHSTKRQAFTRARKSLMEKDLVNTDRDYYWPRDTATVA